MDRSPAELGVSVPLSPGAVRAIIIIPVLLQCLPCAGSQTGEQLLHQSSALGWFWLVVRESCGKGKAAKLQLPAQGLGPALRWAQLIGNTRIVYQTQPLAPECFK